MAWRNWKTQKNSIKIYCRRFRFSMNAKTKTLLKIVETWKLNEKPEYRGFRCANCQKYMHKAYYYWLDTKGYKTPVHFCRQCQKLFESFHIRITKLSHPINRKTFGLKFEQKFIYINHSFCYYYRSRIITYF